MSRNPHEPTPTLRQSVRGLAAVGLPQPDIAAIVGCSEKTLRLYYRQEIEEGAADANAAVVGFLLEAIERGNVIATIFYDKCKGGQREIAPKKALTPLRYSGGELPCNGVGICTLRRPEFYFPGEECWPPIC